MENIDTIVTDDIYVRLTAIEIKVDKLIAFVDQMATVFEGMSNNPMVKMMLPANVREAMEK